MSRAMLLAAGDPLLAASSDLVDARRAVLDADLGDRADPAVRGHRQRVLQFADSHPDALARSCAPGHLTASAAVVDTTGERALLLLHTKLGRWLQPGGHTECDANLAAVALREATEETGIAGLTVRVPAIDVDVHAFRASGEVDHLHFDLRFLVRALAGAVVRINHESRSARWVGVGDLNNPAPGIDTSTRRLLFRAFEVATQG